MKKGWVIFALVAVQFVIAVFFVSDILSGVFGLRTRPLSWQARELLEIGASFGLMIGAVLGGLILRRSLIRQHRAEEGLRLASGDFMQLLEERFAEWKLTPSERDVALFAIKGMSTGEIAKLRDTSEGTVKAQTNAIYRKANVRGRPQLLSLFIEELMAEPIIERDATGT